MARKRMLSPAFFSSTPVNALPIPAMVTYAGLWVYLDDFGRGEDDPPLIKASVWPRRPQIDLETVARHLDLIFRQGLLCRYVINGYPLLHIPSWREHQKISHPTESTYPPCSRHEDVAYRVFRKDSGGPLERFRSRSGRAPEALHDSVVKGSLVKSSSGAGPEGSKCQHGTEHHLCAICRRASIGIVGA